MVRDDLLIGSLRIPIRELQELVNYLESRRGLAGEDIAYCQFKVKDLVKQLKGFERVVESERRRTQPAELFSWN